MRAGAGRLFVGLALPEPARHGLAGWVPSRAELRPVAPQSLHVTLCFLGERTAAEAAAVAGVVQGEAGAHRPIGLAAGERLWLPRRRPRVLAVALADATGELTRLQARVCGALAAAGLHEAESRSFLPHVTVARRRRGAASGGAALPAGPFLEPFVAGPLTLFRSVMGTGGSRYEVLAEQVAD